jgi:hypothetical protein
MGNDRTKILTECISKEASIIEKLEDLEKN